MKSMVYERKVSGREELRHRSFDAAKRMNDPGVLWKVQIILNFRSLVTVENRTNV
jgi:hypothetical protein